jgi:hypothetical protein
MRTDYVVAAVLILAAPAAATDITLTIPASEWDSFVDTFAAGCREVQAGFPSAKKRLASEAELLACAKQALADHVATQIGIRRAAEAAAAASKPATLSVK